MSSLAVAGIILGSVLTGTVAAMWAARKLPEHHLDSPSRDVIKLGLGTIGTLTALVLGLLISATKGTYDAQSGIVKDLATEIALLDRVLARYGPEAHDARVRLRALTESVLEQFWPPNGTPVNFIGGPSRVIGEGTFDAISALEPHTDAQRLLKAKAQDIMVGLGRVRQRLAVNSDHTLPSPLLVGLSVWQAALFVGFGLLAPRNLTTLAVLVVCMVSVAGAVYLVLELDRPFDGLVRVPDAPLRAVLAHLGEP